MTFPTTFKKSLSRSALTAAFSMAVIATSTLGVTKADESALDAALALQDEAAQARFKYRNPKATLEFMEISPGMTVVEVLPGGGWYTKILLPFLGSEGKVIGADYALDMWSNFGFMTPERIEAKKTWTTDWPAQAEEWRGENGASLAAFQFNALPDDMNGTADAVLYIRAMHNLNRFNEKGAYLDNALKESLAVLKPGGILGIVQHEGREDRPDEWADGSNGYLKKSKMIAAAEAAGFEFVAESDVNSNDKDQAKEGDFVWRLPPSYNGTRDDEEKKAAVDAIGESNRMTLKFRKPAA